MRVIVTTLGLVALLLLVSLVLALTGVDDGARLGWQGALIVLGLGALTWAARFIPDGPVGLHRVNGSAFDDPDSFWGRFDRFYRGG